jgi:hypothetical protein
MGTEHVVSAVCLVGAADEIHQAFAGGFGAAVHDYDFVVASRILVTHCNGIAAAALFAYSEKIDLYDQEALLSCAEAVISFRVRPLHRPHRMI